jgi:hypothetical protein
VEWYSQGRAAVDDECRRSVRLATHGVAGHPGPQSVPLGAEIPEGLSEREGEPQVARIPEGPPGLADKVPRYLQW